jgi:hypothetical protein
MAARATTAGGSIATAIARALFAAAILANLPGFATRPAPIAATDPANPSAPAGRLAGAPATLRPGVVDYQLPAPKTEPAPEHHHHHPP